MDLDVDYLDTLGIILKVKNVRLVRKKQQFVALAIKLTYFLII